MNTGKRLWVLLAISAAINCVCLGWFAAGSMRFHRRPESGAGPQAFWHRSGLREAGPAVRALLEDKRPELQASSRAIAEARRNAQVALSAEPFDAARVHQAMSEVRAQTAAMQAAMHATLEEVAGKLTPEQRGRMANALWHRHWGSPLP